MVADDSWNVQLTEALDGGYNDGFEADDGEGEGILLDAGAVIAGENQLVGLLSPKLTEMSDGDGHMDLDGGDKDQVESEYEVESEDGSEGEDIQANEPRSYG